MDDLSLLLASKDQFLSLSAQKIKTLKQAEEYLRGKQDEKLKAVIDNYYETQKNVIKTLENESTFIDFDSYQVEFKQYAPLEFYWKNPSIIEVIGQKGCGKTALLLRLVRQYAKINPDRLITILNCGGGITVSRMKPFQTLKHRYIDIFSIEDLQQILLSFKKAGQKSGLIMIDGVINLILGAAVQRNGLGEWLCGLRDQGWSIIYTNLLQARLEIEEKEVFNSMGYFPNIFGGIVDCRLRIDLSEENQDSYNIQVLKCLDGKLYEYQALMDDSGLSQLILQKQ